jgi:hypothetical protein
MCSIDCNNRRQEQFLIHQLPLDILPQGKPEELGLLWLEQLW